MPLSGDRSGSAGDRFRVDCGPVPASDAGDRPGPAQQHGHSILKEGLRDRTYIDVHASGSDPLRDLIEHYGPVTASAICGIDEDTIRNAARLYARAAMTIWTMGFNPSIHGSHGVVAIDNLRYAPVSRGVAGVAPLCGKATPKRFSS